jgi:hypothetical protein
LDKNATWLLNEIEIDVRGHQVHIAGNISTAEIMRQGLWKSERMVLRHGEHLEAGLGD